MRLGRKVADMTSQPDDADSPLGVPFGDSRSAAFGAAALPGTDRRSAIDAVQLRIGSAISLGLLKPGDRLPDQEDVALGLSVSPITARRALASLAELGVVVRRRGRGGGTFVADSPPKAALAELAASPDEFGAVNRLVDRRLLSECAVTHYAAFNATAEQLDELERLTRLMAESADWSGYHQADEQFHQLVGTASGLGAAVEEYYETLAQLYAYFIPYPIEVLHQSNCDHIALVAALKAGDAQAAVEVSRQHVDILHRTMFMGLASQ